MTLAGAGGTLAAADILCHAATEEGHEIILGICILITVSPPLDGHRKNV